MCILSHLLDSVLIIEAVRQHDTRTKSKRKNKYLKKSPQKVYTELLNIDRDAMKKFESVPEEKKIRKPVAKRPNDVVRFDTLDHWPELTGLQRCKYCKVGRTTTKCIKCQVHLCYVKTRNCFTAYHKR